MNKLLIATILATGMLCVKSLAQPVPISLFNGKDLSGWHPDVPAKDSVPPLINPFIVRNGLLVSPGTPGGHLITD